MGPILWRELVILARRRATYVDRAATAVLVPAALVACGLVWDHLGLDRAARPGATRFAHTAFGLVVAVLTTLTVGLVPGEVAPGVAGERDRKTLDALLASGLTSAGIVAGVMASGLVKTLSGLAVGLSVLALMVPFAGIDPRLVGLTFAGLAATAFATSALAAAVSVEAKTARGAVGVAILLTLCGWIFLPLGLLTALPRIWPAAAGWVNPVACVVLESSPAVVLGNLTGVYRRSSLVEAVAWMIGYEVLGGVVLFAWAVRRLRPASRAVYDSEGRSAFRALRRTRWRSRRPCGDDPVFWHEKHGMRGESDRAWLVGVLINLVVFAGLVRVTYHFAAPAFREVLAYGYTAAPVERVSLEINPFARAIVMAAGKGSALPRLPEGLARYEFNTVLRVVTVCYFLVHVLIVAGYAAESVTSERERDTWLGLIATPLTGREILAAKMLGTVWRLRLVMGGMAGLWGVGLVAGAVHPLGFVTAVVGLGVSAWFLLALGTYVSLWARDRKQAVNRVFLVALVMSLSGLLLVVFRTAVAGVGMGVASMPVIGGLSLLSYEDVRAAGRSGAFPFLAEVGVNTGEGARSVAATCLVGLGAQAALAWYFSRSAFRGFDAAVGRPLRDQAGRPGEGG